MRPDCAEYNLHYRSLAAHRALSPPVKCPAGEISANSHVRSDAAASVSYRARNFGANYPFKQSVVGRKSAAHSAYSNLPHRVCPNEPYRYRSNPTGWRNALRFSALRLLGTSHQVGGGGKQFRKACARGSALCRNCSGSRSHRPSYVRDFSSEISTSPGNSNSDASQPGHHRLAFR